MKKSILTLLIAFTVLVSCSNEDKAKKAIKKHLSETMHDFKSYEPVKYGSLDSTYSKYYNENSYKTLSKTLDIFLDSVTRIHEKTRDLMSENEISALRYYDWYQGSKYDVQEKSDIKKFRMISRKLLDSIDVIMVSLKKDSTEFKPKFNGFKISHSFRGKNSSGATVINSNDFYMNKQLDSVINTVTID